MPRKIIFLDIDGVLNDHEFSDLSQSTTIHGFCMSRFNKILEFSKCTEIVLSSAWRYMINGKDMTCKGFTYMLRTHGLSKFASVIDTTVPDEFCVKCEKGDLARPWQVGGSMAEFNCITCGFTQTRHEQILYWLRKNKPLHYVILDDLDLDFGNNWHFIQTNGKIGLRDAEVDAAIKILNTNYL